MKHISTIIKDNPKYQEIKLIKQNGKFYVTHCKVTLSYETLEEAFTVIKAIIN